MLLVERNKQPHLYSNMAAAKTTMESWQCLVGGWISPAEKDLATTLLSLDQGHIFAKWAVDGDEDKKHAFFEQVRIKRGAAF